MSLTADIITVLNAASAVISLVVTNTKTTTKAIRPNKLMETDVPAGSLCGIVVSGTGRDFANDLGGSGQASQPKIVIDCVGVTALAANALADQVENTLEPYSGTTSGGIIRAVELADRHEEWETTDDGRETGQYIVTVILVVYYKRN